MADLQNIGQMLGGFSAGLQGRLPEFVQGQQNQQRLDMLQQEQSQKLQQERMKTYFVDAQAGLNLLNSGRVEPVVGLLRNRLELLQQFPDADPSDTLTLLELGVQAQRGSKQAQELLKQELESAVEVGRAYGVLEAPKREIVPGSSVINGQIVQFGADGKPFAMPVSGLEREAEVGFSILTPQQAVSMGLDPAKKYQQNTKTNQVSEIGGGGTVVNVGQATEGERTAGILANRLDFAQSQINDILATSPEVKSPGMLPTALSSVGLDYLARISNPDERNVIEAAQMDMLDAALTLGTGAAYTKEQLEGYRKSYFPQLGDGETVINRKAERLKNLIDAAYAKAGRGAPEQRLSESENAGSALSAEERAELEALRARYGR